MVDASQRNNLKQVNYYCQNVWVCEKSPYPYWKSIKLKWNFQRGGAGRGSNQRPSVGGVWIFLEQYILLYLICELRSQ